jgi:hypothetical protein
MNVVIDLTQERPWDIVLLFYQRLCFMSYVHAFPDCSSQYVCSGSWSCQQIINRASSTHLNSYWRNRFVSSNRIHNVMWVGRVDTSIVIQSPAITVASWILSRLFFFCRNSPISEISSCITYNYGFTVTVSDGSPIWTNKEKVKETSAFSYIWLRAQLF